MWLNFLMIHIYEILMFTCFVRAVKSTEQVRHYILEINTLKLVLTRKSKSTFRLGTGNKTMIQCGIL